MSGPNPLLSEWYGTVPNQDPAMDKAAEFIKTASEAGLDVNSMTDEQILGVYNKVAQEAASEGGGGGSEIEDAAEQLADAIAGEAKDEVQSEESKEAELKLAEYDFAGRMMAHAYNDEMNKIAKSRSGGVTLGPQGAKAFEAKELARRAAAIKDLPLKEKAMRLLRSGGRSAAALAKKHKGPLAAAGAGLGALAGGYALGKKTSEDEFTDRVITRMEEKLAAYDDDANVDAVADATLRKLSERGYFNE